MEITMALLKQLRPEIEAALADLGKKYGIGFEVGSGSYNGSHATLKLEVGVLGDAGKAVGILQIHPTVYTRKDGAFTPERYNT